MTSQSQILPENVGWRIGTASLVGFLTVLLFYWVSTLFVISERIQLDSLGLSISLSITLTTILPGLLFRSLLPELRDWIENAVLDSEGVRNRGERDRAVVLLSLIISTIGFCIFLFTPEVLGVKNSQVIHAITNSEYSLMETLRVIYVDIITICGFGLFSGFFIIAWYRIMYPRHCQNCNKARVKGDLCHECHVKNVNRPSHAENVKNFLFDRGMRQYSVVNKSKDMEEGEEVNTADE